VLSAAWAAQIRGSIGNGPHGRVGGWCRILRILMQEGTLSPCGQYLPVKPFLSDSASPSWEGADLLVMYQIS
jgi:hypothetical protein